MSKQILVPSDLVRRAMEFVDNEAEIFRSSNLGDKGRITGTGNLRAYNRMKALSMQLRAAFTGTKRQ